MKTKAKSWGNSLAVRIPKAIATEVGINEDTPVEVSAEDGSITITPVSSSRARLRALVARITPENRYPEMFADRSVGREVW